ncbi:MAG: cytosine permease [Alicyclobacillus sp.]|nr:cytosine permease [Alicyclobacillus sp.]
MNPRSRLTMEHRGISHIPDSERHGNPKNLFSMWFSTNLTVAAFATGAIAIQVGLGIASSIIAMVLGALMGAVLIPALSRIGWKLGISQMMMTRAVFGKVGAVIPSAIAWVNFVGWFTILTVLGAKALNSGFHIPLVIGILVLSVISVLLGICGYDMIQSAERWVAVISGVVFLVVIILILPHVNWSYSGNPKLHGADWWGTFVLVVAIAFSYAGPGYTAYASDYTRYLPKNLKFNSIFQPAFWGMATSCSIIFFLGSAVATTNPQGDPVESLSHLIGGFSPMAMLALALGTVAANAMNVYSGGLTALVSGIRLNRWMSALLTGAIAVALALWAKEQFELKFENYLLLILYLMPPLDAIFLVDFYLVRKGRYRLEDFYGSSKGLFKPRGWIAYIIGILVSIPFMSTAFYTGPVATFLHGADISFMVSMVITGLIYWGMSVRVTENSLVSAEQEHGIQSGADFGGLS